MTDLTDKWEKGELPEGVYYVLYYKNDTAEVDIYRRVYSLYNESEVRFTIPQVTKILAPVPSYEEWKAKLEENIKLKELLKEARNVLKMVDTYYGDYDSINGFLIVEKINQALGEDK